MAAKIQIQKREAVHGFTLIELMIVIAVIAILATVAIPNFMQARDRAKRTGCIQALGTWRKVMEIYSTDQDSGYFATELQGNPAYSNSNPADVELVNSLGKYTNVTNTVRDCMTTTFSSVTNTIYTIVATAKDRTNTVLTADPDQIVQP